MRIKITFAAVRRDTSLPVDYQHFVSALIYDTLASADSDLAAKIHDKGFDSNGRRFKLFTFSRLNTKHARLEGRRLVLKHSNIDLQVASPVAEFIQGLRRGFSHKQQVRIDDAWFAIKAVTWLPAPPFEEKMSFRALSPITESYNKLGEPDRFLSLTDDWSELIRLNLLGKYKALRGIEPDDQRLVWRWDEEYIAKANRRGKRLSVLKSIHGIDIRGWLAPFTVDGSTELIELGYNAGFGSHNSIGFGMAEYLPPLREKIIDSGSNARKNI